VNRLLTAALWAHFYIRCFLENLINSGRSRGVTIAAGCAFGKNRPGPSPRRRFSWRMSTVIGGLVRPVYSVSCHDAIADTLLGPIRVLKLEDGRCPIAAVPLLFRNNAAQDFPKTSEGSISDQRADVPAWGKRAFSRRRTSNPNTFD